MSTRSRRTSPLTPVSESRSWRILNCLAIGLVLHHPVRVRDHVVDAPIGDEPIVLVLGPPLPQEDQRLGLGRRRLVEREAQLDDLARDLGQERVLPLAGEEVGEGGLAR